MEWSVGFCHPLDFWSIQPASEPRHRSLSSLLQCPIGEVVEGMGVLDRLQKTEPVTSEEIDQLMTLGNKWADEWNPDLSYIKTARIRETSGTAAAGGGEAAKQEL
jgi:hypothetical protein